jgi:hypothetical protein
MTLTANPPPGRDFIRSLATIKPNQFKSATVNNKSSVLATKTKKSDKRPDQSALQKSFMKAEATFKPDTHFAGSNVSEAAKIYKKEKARLAATKLHKRVKVTERFSKQDYKKALSLSRSLDTRSKVEDSKLKQSSQRQASKQIPKSLNTEESAQINYLAKKSAAAHKTLNQFIKLENQFFIDEIGNIDTKNVAESSNFVENLEELKHSNISVPTKLGSKSSHFVKVQPWNQFQHYMEVVGTVDRLKLAKEAYKIINLLKATQKIEHEIKTSSKKEDKFSLDQRTKKLKSSINILKNTKAELKSQYQNFKDRYGIDFKPEHFKDIISSLEIRG